MQEKYQTTGSFMTKCHKVSFFRSQLREFQLTQIYSHFQVISCYIEMIIKLSQLKIMQLQSKSKWTLKSHTFFDHSQNISKYWFMYFIKLYHGWPCRSWLLKESKGWLLMKLFVQWITRRKHDVKKIWCQTKITLKSSPPTSSPTCVGNNMKIRKYRHTYS